MAGHGHPVARRLHAALGAGVPGQVAGRMLALPDPDGWYPAMVSGAGVVRGTVHAADRVDDDLWSALDAYEQVVAAGAGYVRAVVAVMGLGPAQAYVWQGALPEGALAVEDGDFAAFLLRMGQRAFGS